MTADLPDRWEDEPWPLDDPVPAPGLNPTNWSDTHDEPPQVADLADEAWEYAVDHGISLERALVELQDRAVSGFHTGGMVHAGGTFSIGWSGGQQTVHWFPSHGSALAPTPDDPAVAGVDLTQFIAWPDPDQHWIGFDPGDDA